MELKENTTYRLEMKSNERQALKDVKSILENLYDNLTDEQLEYFDNKYFEYATLEDAPVLAIICDMLEVLLNMNVRG